MLKFITLFLIKSLVFTAVHVINDRFFTKEFPHSVPKAVRMQGVVNIIVKHTSISLNSWFSPVNYISNNDPYQSANHPGRYYGPQFLTYAALRNNKRTGQYPFACYVLEEKSMTGPDVQLFLITFLTTVNKIQPNLQSNKFTVTLHCLKFQAPEQ